MVERWDCPIRIAGKGKLVLKLKAITHKKIIWIFVVGSVSFLNDTVVWFDRFVPALCSTNQTIHSMLPHAHPHAQLTNAVKPHRILTWNGTFICSCWYDLFCNTITTQQAICLGCRQSVGKGTRFNAKKTNTGELYFSTKIYEFRLSCRNCQQYVTVFLCVVWSHIKVFVLHCTFPENGAFNNWIIFY